MAGKATGPAFIDKERFEQWSTAPPKLGGAVAKAWSLGMQKTRLKNPYQNRILQTAYLAGREYTERHEARKRAVQAPNKAVAYPRFGETEHGERPERTRSKHPRCQARRRQSTR